MERSTDGLSIVVAVLLGGTFATAFSGMIVAAFEDEVEHDSLWDHTDRELDGGIELWNQAELVYPSAGYLGSTAPGPQSGITYGSTSWLETRQNYSDRFLPVLNPPWESDVSRSSEAFLRTTDEYTSSLVGWPFAIDATDCLPPHAGLTDAWEDWPAVPSYYASDTEE